MNFRPVFASWSAPLGIVGLVGLVGVAALTAACTTPPAAPAAAVPARPAAFTPVTAGVIAPPMPVAATDGRTHLAYELLLTNTLSQPAAVEAVEVVEPAADDRALVRLEGERLAAWMRVLGADPGRHVIGPGQQALVWIDLALPPGAPVPSRLVHRVELRFATPSPPLVPARLVQRVAEAEVSKAPPVVIAPPLRGGGWLNGNSCCELTPHRAAVSPIDGRLQAAERFAIDYVRIDAARRFFTGDIRSIGSYAYFGDTVHAVADGPVVGLQQDQPEQTPGANPQGLALHQYGGNYVVQDLGGGRYAFYAHLQPGNAAGLALGRMLRRGEVLGRLGNSGNSDAPHLHFHVMDGPDPLGSNGLPFVFDAFDLEGRVASVAALERAFASGGPLELDTAAPGPQRARMPLFLDLMRYPAR